MKIGDLGVSKKLNKTNFAKTFIGTPYYLSPEICEDKPYNEKSDIWALGVILYEMCTFKHPFEAKSQPGLIMKILKGKYEEIPNTYSTNLRDMVKQLLEKDFEKRPNVFKILNKNTIIERVKKEKMESSVIELFPELNKLYGMNGNNNNINNNSGNIKQYSQHEMIQYMNQNGYKFDGILHDKGKILIRKKQFDNDNSNSNNNSKRIGSNSSNQLNKNNSKNNLNGNNKGNSDSHKKEQIKLIAGANSSNNINSGSKRMINHRIKIVNPNEKQYKEVSKRED